MSSRNESGGLNDSVWFMGFDNAWCSESRLYPSMVLLIDDGNWSTMTYGCNIDNQWNDHSCLILVSRSFAG